MNPEIFCQVSDGGADFSRLHLQRVLADEQRHRCRGHLRLQRRLRRPHAQVHF